jgi:pantetheine-phosphate adenylyltransferase
LIKIVIALEVPNQVFEIIFVSELLISFLCNLIYQTLKRQMKIAVFPGSFDPITLGHVDLVRRAVPLFDKIIVAVGINNYKTTLFSLEKRIEWLKQVFKEYDNVEISYFEGLTVRFCQERGAHYLIRGLRNASDFDYEKTISQINTIMGKEVETIFLISQPEYSHISSTIVREVIKGKGDVSAFVPKNISKELLTID